MSADADRWGDGTARIDAVYGPGFSDRLPTTEKSPWLVDTVEHLFADIWSRPGLSIRDRRLLTIGATASLGRSDLIRIQTLGALLNEELDADQLREAILHLAYYVGWGNASALSTGIEEALTEFAELGPVLGEARAHQAPSRDGTDHDHTTDDCTMKETP